MEQIGPYEILGELGRGGMGIVYRGLDPVIGRTVAVKTVHSSDLGDSAEQTKLKDRLFREAKSAGMLSHPGIVTIYQAGQDKDVLFIAMEFIDGPNLADALARTRPSVELTLQILKQAAEALDYAHSKGVIHRDIKPANLLLQSEGRIKVADFGIAKIAATNLTKTGTTVGSPAYMSPEQIRAMAMDGRADQYSLGIVAYEMLTGLRPYDSDTITSLVFKVVFEQPDLSKLEQVPGGLRMDPVFRKVLAKSAEDRFPNCMAFWQALSDAANGVEQGPATDFEATLPLNQSKSAAASGAGASAPPPMRLETEARPAVVAPVQPPPSQPVAAEKRPAYQPPPAAMPVEAQSSKRGLMFVGIAVAAVVLGGGGYWMWSQRSQPVIPEHKEKENRDKDRIGKKGPVEGAHEKVVPPQVIASPEAEYTPEAQKAGIEGVVRLRIGIDERGRVTEARVVKALDPGLDRKAIQAVLRWTFKPATFNGKPVPFEAQVEQHFVIPK